MDREINPNPYRGYPMSNPTGNPNSPAAARYAAAEGHRSNSTPRYTDDYNTLASHLARLTLEQSPLFSHGDMLQQLRIQSAARAMLQPQNYQNRTPNGLFNNGNLYNSLPLNGDAVNYNNPLRLNLIGLLNGDARNYMPRASDQYEIGNGFPMNFNRNIGRWNSVSVTRPRPRPNLALHEMRGKIVTVAKDQHGCRFLQNKFAEGNPEEIQMIFVEIKDHIYELMVHQFGNYLIQKFVEVCNQEQTTQLLLLVINDDRKFADICADMYGTRAVQKLLEHLTTQEQRCCVISVLRRITVSLTKTMNGHHVLQHCLKYFSIEDNKHILNVVADNCLDIATDKSGCCVLQQCLEHALGEPRQRLIAKLTSNALQLSHHPFGNYVVQYILGLKIGHATADILRQLSGNYVFLCMDKYGSNVVERCLKESEENQKIPIIEEIIYSPNFLEVLQDPYGNYVAQRALNTCKGALLHAIIEMINRNSPNLHSHPHGKRVLEKTTKGSYKPTFG